MENTFDSMPQRLAEIERKLSELHALMAKQAGQEEDRKFTITELCEYLPEHPAKQTVYGWVWDRKIPYEKHGRNLYFQKSAIDQWLNNGRQK